MTSWVVHCCICWTTVCRWHYSYCFKQIFPEMLMLLHWLPVKLFIAVIFMWLNLNCRHDYFQRKITEKKQQMAEKAQLKTQWVYASAFFVVEYCFYLNILTTWSWDVNSKQSVKLYKQPLFVFYAVLRYSWLLLMPGKCVGIVCMISRYCT